MSCDAFDRAGRVGLKTIKSKLSWPFPKDDKNRPIVPEEEEKRLAALNELEKRGSEISAKIKADAAAKKTDAATKKAHAAPAATAASSSASTPAAPAAPTPPALPAAAAPGSAAAPAPAATNGGAVRPAT